MGAPNRFYFTKQATSAQRCSDQLRLELGGGRVGWRGVGLLTQCRHAFPGRIDPTTVAASTPASRSVRTPYDYVEGVADGVEGVSAIVWSLFACETTSRVAFACSQHAVRNSPRCRELDVTSWPKCP